MKNETSETAQATENKAADASPAPVKPTKRTFDEVAFGAAAAPYVDPEVLKAALEGASLVASGDPAVDMAKFAKSQGVATQGHVAGLLVEMTYGAGLPEGNKFRELKADDLTEILKAAFPGAGIGKRHGPHYLSHARRGALKGQVHGTVTIPFARRVATGKVAEAAKSEPPPKAEDPQTDEKAMNLAEVDPAEVEKMDRIGLQELLRKAHKPHSGKTADLKARAVAAIKEAKKAAPATA